MSCSLPLDVLVIGSGAAGLSLALELPASTRVAVLSKQALSAGASQYAQGGVACVLGEQDSFDSHIQDTLVAGADLCHRPAVEKAVQQAPACIQWLADLGVPFTLGDGGLAQAFDLTREGGHSHRRIVHADDATGKAIHEVLVARAQAAANITLLSNHIAVDLVITDKYASSRRCQGAYVLDTESGKVLAIAARSIVLATGGASRAYLYTTNPDVASGDGIAMAWRAGCRVANMEFNQFHPTCLYHPEARSFLLTEAIRGEGGLLRRKDGSCFMPEHHPRAELACRDVVARAIDHEMKKSGEDCVYLDISHKPDAFIRERFPNIVQNCLKYGFDLTKGPVPVVPAAHYTCGGVVTDLSGQTDIPGLYAIGETAHTGLHGANRMASNSLLECFVFAKAAADDITEKLPLLSPSHVRPWDDSRVRPSMEAVVVSHDWEELRRTMWDLVGIVRTEKRLSRAQERLKLLRQEIHEYYSHYLISRDLLELRNLIEVSDLIIRCALSRKESRGLHTILDYPEKLPGTPHDTILAPYPIPSLVQVPA